MRSIFLLILPALFTVSNCLADSSANFSSELSLDDSGSIIKEDFPQTSPREFKEFVDFMSWPKAGETFHVSWDTRRLPMCDKGSNVVMEGKLFDLQGKLITLDQSLGPHSFSIKATEVKENENQVMVAHFDVNLPQNAVSVALWFHETNCNRYDSANGKNFSLHLNQAPVNVQRYNCFGLFRRAHIFHGDIFVGNFRMNPDQSDISFTSSVAHLDGKQTFADQRHSVILFHEPGTDIFFNVYPEFNGTAYIDYGDGTGSAYCQNDEMN